jgi:predicted  nucleic acid-binding Zn-ribbon protein
VSRIQALEAEVEQLRSQAMPGLDLKEIEKLRTDLAAAKRQALKMENEKMALERSIEREMEDIKSKLSDANDELDYLRSLDGQSAQKQLDDAKKAAKQERQSLEDRLGKQQDDLEQRSIVIHRLEFRLKEVEADLQDKQQSFLTLEQELAATKSGSSNGNMMNSQSQIEAVREDLIAKTQERDAAMSQVKELQKELRNMSVQTSDASIAAPATAQADKILRAIQRENAALKRDKAALEDNLAEIEDLVMTKDAEILALASRMPLPDGQEDDDSEVMATGDTSEIRIALAETIENLQTITSEKDALERKLQQLEATLSNSKRELLQHEEEIELLRTRLTEQQSHVGDRANEESVSGAM